MPKPKSALRKIPEFRSEADEQEFWATADSSQYIDWSKAEVVRCPKVNLADRVCPPLRAGTDKTEGILPAAGIPAAEGWFAGSRKDSFPEMPEAS